MNLTKLMYFLFAGILLHSCSTTKPQNKIFWVSGMRTECSGGAGKMQCLNVHKGEDLESAQWENFYSGIEGFEFEEGVMKKLEVKEEKIENPPADGSSIKYTMVRELEKMTDFRVSLQGDWVLSTINDAPINRATPLPKMTLDLSKQEVAGNGGCNQYSGKISKLTSEIITFGPIAATKRACLGNNIEQKYFDALSKVSSYEVKGDQLRFLNAQGEEILAFLRGMPQKADERIHDIWMAAKIMGNPINRMSPIPRMEINLTEMRVMGNDGCNEYTGKIESITDAKMQFGNISSTEKMCRKMDVPDAYNKAMSQVASYKLDGLNLTLLNAANEEVLFFIKGD